MHIQEVAISVLMKLTGGCPSMADQLNVDAFLEQAHSYEKASSSPIGWYIRNAQTRQLSHPLPVLRAREIDEWSRSREYRSLLDRATQMSIYRLCLTIYCQAVESTEMEATFKHRFDTHRNRTLYPAVQHDKIGYSNLLIL
ncbi:protease HtpX-like protein isoform X2 [Gossypium australe]|uniref:Protease HtpX-like protein isoform X2 n=1 Tax=Gossypium australe TaxID=47621 RepID=A0A5B6W2T5_9ROSI|nr:protease HtpX-like protein isoform X2 [Gossypium australe]